MAEQYLSWKFEMIQEDPEFELVSDYVETHQRDGYDYGYVNVFPPGDREEGVILSKIRNIWEKAFFRSLPLPGIVAGKKRWNC